MKICTTCGASVADDAEVCPDCGMDLKDSGAQIAVAPPAAPAPAPSSDPFGDDFAAPAPVVDLAKVDPNDPFPNFGPSGTIALQPPPPEPSAPSSFILADSVLSAGMASLTLKRGGLMTKEVFQFGGNAIVGRFDPDSGPVDIDLGPLPEASYVSRHHAELKMDVNGKWSLKDLGSRNGTFWRAGGSGQFQRVAAEQPLESGDEVALGNARFEFKAGF